MCPWARGQHICMYVGGRRGRSMSVGCSRGAAMYQQAADFVARRPCLGTSSLTTASYSTRATSLLPAAATDLPTPVSPPSNRKPRICTCMCVWSHVGGGVDRRLLLSSLYLSPFPFPCHGSWRCPPPTQSQPEREEIVSAFATVRICMCWRLGQAGRSRHLA